MAVLGATNLTGCNSIPDFIAGGSLVTFQQTAAPTSWTKQTTHNNKALRVVSGTATPGGSTAFTSVFASRTPAGSVNVTLAGGSVNNHTLTAAQIPSHTHNQGPTASLPSPDPTPGGPARAVRGVNSPFVNSGASTLANTPADGAHAHPFTLPTATGTFTGTALDFNVQYVDIIICSKN